MKKALSDIIQDFEYTSVLSDGITPSENGANPDITALAFDSRDVTAGTLFFALPGTHTTGNTFIPQAIKAGAAAVIFQDSFSPELQQQIAEAMAATNASVPLIKVSSSRYVMAPVAAAFYDNPSKKLVVIGVTGTEGKSSTVSFIWQLLRLCGKKAGFISTVQYSLGGEAIANPQHQTTPEAPIIQHHLAEMVQAGCEYAVVESSSHGLSEKTNRTGCLDYDCAVFMNVTLEHLEFHKTFEQYRDDKANLFRKLDQNDHKKVINGTEKTIPSFGIVNLEDESAPYFIHATTKPVLGFTTEGKAGKSAGELTTEAAALPPIPDGIPYLVARNIASARFGLTFSIVEPNVVDKNSRPVSTPVIHIKSSLPGAFNAYNIMAAMIAVSRLTDTPLPKLADLVPNLQPVKGRMTVIDKGQPFELIVDYAHTPSSFETIFPPIRRRCKGKMIAVFGSGGERDTEKRPLQGSIAARFCETLILTDEDPRGEDSVALLSQIAEGAEKAGKHMNEDMFITPDRPTAVRQALNMAKKDDIVLLLGKSHENSIIYKDHIRPYDEISEAETALEEMGYK
ncbi:MAG: UDP-N-acetylmuramyl-tripeptide synthetase [Treponema sp.]|nr:UDP-N-acetylmuramyl-tripeptide synthetase [Treponema sp.]